MSACGIYCYTDKNTNKIVYIGKDSHINYNKRDKEHKYPSTYNAQQINKVIQNNPERYSYSILVKGNFTKNLLNWLEIKYISKYKPLFNFTKGGESMKSGKYHMNYREDVHKFKNEIIEMYTIKKYNGYLIGAIFNCDPSTIYNLLKENNIKLRNKKRTDVRKFEKEIIEMYNIKKYSKRKIATRFKCSDGVISRILRDNNITWILFKTITETRIYKKKLYILVSVVIKGDNYDK